MTLHSEYGFVCVAALFGSTFQVLDEPEEVVEAIFKHYERRGFQPLPAEREMMLNL